MEIVKRDGSREAFNSDKIERAARKCLDEVHGAFKTGTPRGNQTAISSRQVADSVANIVVEKYSAPNFPTVEQVQDLVEMQLMAIGEFAAAKAYILYRREHERLRDDFSLSPEDAAKVRDAQKYFATPLQAFQFMDKYARWHPQAQRRETWDETVTRVLKFFMGQIGVDSLPLETWNELREAMLNMEAMPSMRTLQMAGPALERCNVGVYNCAYVALDSLKAFSELLYVLMQGTGAGFSVEYEVVENLPRIKRQRPGMVPVHVIPDSTEGWCDALAAGLSAWHAGRDITFDYSHIRPAGTVLRTKGGRASGPEPLKRLLSFVRDKVLSRQGACLMSIDAHDIATMCGDIVQVGGVRRAALISLSDLNDMDMRRAKDPSELFFVDPTDGQTKASRPYRFMANNSAVYNGKPSSVEFMEEWLSLAKSGTGERGIFNREGVLKQIPKRRKKARFGVNPCGEIVLRSRQFCNLSIAIARENDTEASLHRKVRIAAIFGTIQSMLTKFNYISDEWKKNCEEERLLGVDITGQMDCHLLSFPVYKDQTDPGNRLARGSRALILDALKKTAIETNKEFAAKLGINPSAAVTCVKPSGNSSVLFDCSSGLHARFAPYYIRRVRVMAGSPMAKVLQGAGMTWEPETGQTRENARTIVFAFPMKSPEGAVTVKEMGAMAQLENWLDIKRFFTEHNPSCTIHLSPEEWVEAGHWVYKNWDLVGGLSFMPHGGVYALAPQEEITKEQYEQMLAELPAIDYSKLARYEREDMTTVATDFACVSGNCEI